MGERLQCWVACASIACASIACGATAEDTARNGVRGAGTGGGAAFGNAGAAASAGTAGTNGFGNPEMTNPIAGTGQTINMPPDDVCESIRITADPQIPDMLIVLDRSGSMTEGGRWTPSVSALRNVTQQLQSQI